METTQIVTELKKLVRELEANLPYVPGENSDYMDGLAHGKLLGAAFISDLIEAIEDAN